MHTLPLPEMPEADIVRIRTQVPQPEAPIAPASTADGPPGAGNSRFKIQDSKTSAAQLPPDSTLITAGTLRAGAALAVRVPPQQFQFLMRIAAPSLASEAEYGVPACVTMAQAILESATPAGWGSSILFRLANNPFGIKYCHFPSKNEDYGAFDAVTWEMVDGHKQTLSAQFQRFPNLQEAFRAHALLLRSPRYGPAFAVRHDWKQFAERLGPKSSPHDLEHCGYSTDPSYPAEITKLITLYRLDDRRLQRWYATGQDPGLGLSSG